MMSLSLKNVLLFHGLWAAQAFSGRPFLSSSFSASSSRLSVSTEAASTSATSAAFGNTIKFSKYEGLGNDFILIDDRDKKAPSLSPEQAEKLCHRNFGVGGDGVIFALQPPDADHDFTMRIYNSDGSEPEMCGNGIRCFAQFLKDLGADKETYNIHTLAGLIVPVMNADGTITVNMGEPVLDGPTIPTTLTPNGDLNSVVEQDIIDNNGKTWKISTVSMGNPHAIIFVDDLENDVNLAVDGPALELASAFPAKTNVEFVQVMAPDHLKMVVWERGAGPTLACGTGACALTVAAIRAGKIPQAGPVRVTLPGGDLFIEWRPTDNRILMTGPATFAFNGNAKVA
jgi:diaminopimelate epimerase